MEEVQSSIGNPAVPDRPWELSGPAEPVLQAAEPSRAALMGTPVVFEEGALWP